MNKLNVEKKIEIVANFLKAEKKISKKEFSEKNGISPRSLGRYIDSFKDEAVVLNKKRDNKKEVVVSGKRGYKGRNGRWDCIWSAIANVGIDSESKVILAEINKISVERGLKPLSKKSGYALISHARKVN